MSFVCNIPDQIVLNETFLLEVLPVDCPSSAEEELVVAVLLRCIDNGGEAIMWTDAIPSRKNGSESTISSVEVTCTQDILTECDNAVCDSTQSRGSFQIVVQCFGFDEFVSAPLRILSERSSKTDQGPWGGLDYNRDSSTSIIHRLKMNKGALWGPSTSPASISAAVASLVSLAACGDSDIVIESLNVLQEVLTNPMGLERVSCCGCRAHIVTTTAVCLFDASVAFHPSCCLCGVCKQHMVPGEALCTYPSTETTRKVWHKKCVDWDDKMVTLTVEEVPMKVCAGLDVAALVGGFCDRELAQIVKSITSSSAWGDEAVRDRFHRFAFKVLGAWGDAAAGASAVATVTQALQRVLSVAA